MDNYTTVGVDQSNPLTHVLIRVNRPGQEPWTGAVRIGDEQKTANDVLGIPNEQPAPPVADTTLPETEDTTEHA